MKVAVAVITDSKQQVLIARRPQHATHGGMWEFPGGKLESEESAFSALVREIKEEVGLDVINGHFLGEINYSYPHQQVTLLVYHVTQYHGSAIRCEEQMDLRWVNLSSLTDYAFPAANEQVIKLIQQKVCDDALTVN